MGRIKKILFWVLFGFGTTCIILLSTFFLSFKLINQESLKNEILNSASKKMGGKLEFEDLSFGFLPRPHVTVHGARLSIPENITGSIRSLNVYPEIIPLLKGKISLIKLKLEKPEFVFTVTQTSRPVKFHAKLLGYETIKDRISHILLYEMFKSTDLVIVIADGNINLAGKKTSITRYSAINAKIFRRWGTLFMEARCQSNISKDIRLTAQTKSDAFKIKGQLQLRDVNPQFLFDLIQARHGIQVRESRNDLYLTFDTPQEDLFHVKIAGNIQRLVLEKNKEKTLLQGRYFELDLKSESHGASFNLSRLNMDRPKLDLTGNGFIDWKNKKSELKFKGRRIQAGPLRQAVLLTGGGNKIIQFVAGIIKKGYVPEISVTSRGATLSDLGLFKNIRIRGRMENGNIFVPEALLDLKNASGEVDIRNCVLHGKNLKASLENTQGHEGKLEIGLIKKKAIPFRLDIKIQADLSLLPPVLKRLIRSDIFQNELSRIRHFKGKAVGRLMLGDTLDSIQTRILVDEAELETEYERIPYPVQIARGEFTMDPEKISVKNLIGTIGGSSFSYFSMEIQLETPYRTRLQGLSARLDMKEIHGWLDTYDFFQPLSKDYHILEGYTEINDFKITGPLLNFDDWIYQTKGAVNQMTVKSSLLPQPLTFEEGQFEIRKRKVRNLCKTLIFIDPTYIKYKDCQLGLNGDIGIADKNINLNLDLTADRFSWDMFDKILTHNRKNPDSEKRWAILGDISLKTGRFEYQTLFLEPFQAEIFIMPNDILMDITRAELCGISIPGSIKFRSNDTEIFLSPKSEKQSVADTLSCAWREDKLATGYFDLTGQLQGKANQDRLSRDIKGRLELVANSGRIYRVGLLSKIFAILNVTEIFKGKLPDLVEEGFAYQTVKARGEVKEGKLILMDFVIDGSSMTIFFEGEIDVVGQELNLTILVAPFKTIDSIIKYIPLVKQIMDGNLVSIPFQVTGKWSDYQVTPLPPKKIGNRMLDIMKRTLQAPIKIIQPVVESGPVKPDRDVPEDRENLK